MKQIRYTVYDNTTDFPVIVCGTPAECAAAMGVSREEFGLLKWRFFNGKGCLRWFFIREVCEW